MHAHLHIRVGREVEEDVLEVGGLGGDLVQHDAVVERELGDEAPASTPPTTSHVAPLAGDVEAPPGQERARELVGLRRVRTRTRGPEPRLSASSVLVGDQPAVVDDDDLVDGLGDLGEHVAGEEHGAPLGRPAPQEVAPASGCPRGRARWRARRGRGSAGRRAAPPRGRAAGVMPSEKPPERRPAAPARSTSSSSSSARESGIPALGREHAEMVARGARGCEAASSMTPDLRERVGELGVREGR